MSRLSAWSIAATFLAVLAPGRVQGDEPAAARSEPAASPSSLPASGRDNAQPEADTPDTKPQCEAGAKPQQAETRGQPQRKSPAFKVVFWYQNGQLKHQAYDVRKGQYTKAVDDWVNRVHYDSSGLYVVPGPLAFVRDVFLDTQPGENEPRKLAAAIAEIERQVNDRERQAIVDRVYTRAYVVPAARFATPLEPQRTPWPQPLPIWMSSPGAGGYSVPPTPPFPFPYPYVRPHP
jgi:hypothetical protein